MHLKFNTFNFTMIHKSKKYSLRNTLLNKITYLETYGIITTKLNFSFNKIPNNRSTTYEASKPTQRDQI